MSEIIGEFVNGKTVIYWRLAYYEKQKYYYAYVAVDGKHKEEISDIFFDYGYEPELFSGVREIVLYNGYENTLQFEIDMNKIISDIRREGYNAFIIFRYMAFNSVGFKYVDYEWRFKPEDEDAIRDIEYRLR